MPQYVHELDQVRVLLHQSQAPINFGTQPRVCVLQVTQLLCKLQSAVFCIDLQVLFVGECQCAGVHLQRCVVLIYAHS